MQKIIFYILLLCSFASTTKAQIQYTTESPKHEIRAVWLTTLNGLDWPKTKANTAAGRERQKEELCQILDKLQQANINTILLQTRVRGTTIYPSAIEPWDDSLTGTTGRDPGYDPLQFAIEECHKRGMELHAWMVTIPCFKIAKARSLGAKSVLRTHPELCKKHEDGWYLDPGIPGTADYLAKICAEITSRYDIDGIHFDYIRYPENATRFNDNATFKRYGKGQQKNEWRRNNVTHCVRTMYNTIKEIKPWVKVSSSPIGKYRDLSRYSARGWNAYNTVHQDAQAWLKEGIHDALFPMMYFQGDNFYPFAYNWQEECNDRFIVPGLGIYFLHPAEKNWDINVVKRKLNVIRKVGTQGAAYFRSKFLTDNTKGLYDFLEKDYYPYPALVPPMKWVNVQAPKTPSNLIRQENSISWATDNNNAKETATYYNVYASEQYPVDTDDPKNLIAVRIAENSFTIPWSWTKKGNFAVTAMDRYGNESKPATTVAPQANTSILLPHRNNILEVPQNKAEFIGVANMGGQLIKTYRNTAQLNITDLPKGFYEIRTVEKKGISRRLGIFAK